MVEDPQALREKTLELERQIGIELHNLRSDLLAAISQAETDLLGLEGCPINGAYGPLSRNLGYSRTLLPNAYHN
jgi:hypothetical protein